MRFAALLALLLAGPAAAGNRCFGAGIFLASATDGPRRRDAALSLELGYEWTHAAVGINVLGTTGYSNLGTTAASVRAAWIALEGPISPYLGLGGGLFSQVLHCTASDGPCLDFSTLTGAGIVEGGVLLFRTSRIGHLGLSVQFIQPVVRSQPAASPAVPATPFPVLLFGLRALGG